LAVVANTEKLGKDDRRHLRDALAGAGHVDPEWIDVTGGSAATAATKKALKHGATTVLVCGGDGTVRAAAEAMVGTAARLAILPCGTANLLASGLGLPSTIDDVVDMLVAGGERRIDSATCNDRTFNVMAGVGFDVAMLGGAEDGKERLGMLAYIGSAVREARHRKTFALTVTVDGKRCFSGRSSCLLVGNAGRLKGGVVAFPGASSTDGLLHVAVVTATGLRQWGTLVTRVLIRRQRWSGQAQFASGAAITVKFEKKQRFELDGGVKSQAKRLEFESRPRSLTVCAPVS